MALSTRPHPADRLPLIQDLRLINLTARVERLAAANQGRELRRLLYDIARGDLPESE